MKKLLLFTAGLYISQFIFAQTPVAYYPFNGNANDAIGFLNGTVNGATLTADRFGNANRAYSFDGVNDNITFSQPWTTLTDNFTISVWLKPNSLGGSILTNGQNSYPAPTGYSGYSIKFGTRPVGDMNGVASFNGGVDVLTVGNWFHIVLVRDNGTAKLYVNGELQPNTINNGPYIPATSAIIGSLNNGVDFVNGSIDEVKIYNTALADQQISDLYNKGEICNGFDDDNDDLIDEACIPSVSIANKSLDEGNSDTTELKLTVTLNHAFDSTVTVKFKTSNKTATAGSDYVAVNDKVKFKPGQTSKKITIGILGDVISEQNEDFYIILSNPVNATLGTDTVIIKIKNDDASFAARSNEIKDQFSIRISPNPAKDILTVSGIKTLKGVIEITNLQGYVMLRQSISNMANINISKLQQGMYMLRYIQQNEVKTIQFVKE